MVMDLMKLQILAEAYAKAEANSNKLREQRDAGIRELAANPVYTVADIARHARTTAPRIHQIIKPPKGGKASGALNSGD